MYVLTSYTYKLIQNNYVETNLKIGVIFGLLYKDIEHLKKSINQSMQIYMYR